MPFIKLETIQQSAAAPSQGADIAVSIYNLASGNPVGFGKRHLQSLLQLSEDICGGKLLKAHPVTEMPVDDSSVYQDIGTVSDL